MRDVDAKRHLGPPRNVRLNCSLRARLDHLAARFNLSASVLIRAAISAKLPEWESGRIVLIPQDGSGED